LVVASSKARYALAVIRIVNGAIALGAPSVIVKRFGETPGDSAAAIYGLRLFGVRTVLIGADLVTQRGSSLLHATSQAVVIHASDTMTAAGLGIFGRLRPRMAIPLALISAINTVLATIAWLASRRQELTEVDSLAAALEAPCDDIGVEPSARSAPLAANLADAGMRVLPLEAGIEGGRQRRQLGA
jgi:hypothetical protein